MIDQLLQQIAALPHHSIQHYRGGVTIVYQPSTSQLSLKQVWTSAPSTPERAAAQLRAYLAERATRV